MKIQLPNGKDKELNDSLTFEEKKRLVEELTQEWEDVIQSNWMNNENNTIKYFLDSLANYLIWHKEEDSESQNVREDKYVMSRNKTNRLYRGRKDILFSDLNNDDKVKLFGERGIEE